MHFGESLLCHYMEPQYIHTVVGMCIVSGLTRVTSQLVNNWTLSLDEAWQDVYLYNLYTESATYYNYTCTNFLLSE